MKKLIFLLVAIVSIGITYKYSNAMINPGKLVAGHQNLSNKCMSCHQPLKGISSEKCIVCHKLSEIEKDTLNGNDSISKNKKILFHQGLVNQDCTACHSDHKGIKPSISISKFEHGLLSETITNNCVSCHKQPVNELHNQLSTNCNSCHNTSNWKLAGNFNHNMIKGTDTNNCKSCHQSPKDTFHNSLGVNSNCKECHSTNKWLPSTFNHASFFQLDRNHNTNCTTCHTNNILTEYTCYGCHEHSLSRISGKHLEEGINNFKDCVSCHKSANEHDIRMSNSKNGTKDNSKHKKEHESNGGEDEDDD